MISSQSQKRIEVKLEKIEKDEEAQDSETDEDVISDKNKIDNIEIDNNQSIAERSVLTEMEAKHEPPETSLMVAPLISEESFTDNLLNEEQELILKMKLLWQKVMQLRRASF